MHACDMKEMRGDYLLFFPFLLGKMARRKIGEKRETEAGNKLSDVLRTFYGYGGNGDTAFRSQDSTKMCVSCQHLELIYRM